MIYDVAIYIQFVYANSYANFILTLHILFIHAVVWKSTSSSKKLKPDDLLPISKVISHWKELARHLGLSKADIVAIEHNHLHDYEEQKYQMLRKWFEQNSTPPSRQSLIKTIEEKMKDCELAGEVDSVLYRLDMEEGEKLRSRSCLT